MITLITGALGTGKTALAVKLVTESEFYPSSAFVFGVRGWKGAGHYEELPADPVKNQARVETVGRIGSSVFFIDEGKKIWPSRVAGRPVPAFIDDHLSESRSVGQDWIITAQAPGQLDIALRRLVGRHIHLEKVAVGVKKCESGACRDDLKFQSFECEKYSFPVSSLALYDSSDLETKAQKKGLAVPSKFLWLGLLIILMGAVVVYFAMHSAMFQSAFGKKAAPPVVVSGEVVPGVSDGGRPLGTAPAQAVAVFQVAKDISYFQPRNSAYPEIGVVSRFPVACVSGHGECVCYDQAGQYLEGIGAERCMKIVHGKNELAHLYPRPAPEEKPVEGPRLSSVPDDASLRAGLVAQGYSKEEAGQIAEGPGQGMDLIAK